MTPHENPIGPNRQIGVSASGHPIYLYFDKGTNTYRYVVSLPTGKRLFANERGEPLVTSTKPVLPLAVLGGSVGFLAGGGPVGAIIGSLIGVIAGENMRSGPRK